MGPPTDRGCCSDFAVSRRALLGGGLALAGATTLFGSAVVTAAPSFARSGDGTDSVLVVLSLRGAADGLSLVVLYTDRAYYAARPVTAVHPDELVAETKDGRFGLHPALAPLLPLWRAGRLGAVTATGLPTPNRSHFSAMEEVEDADPGSAARVGWLNRLLGALPGSSPLRGFDLGGGVVPTSLAGPEPVMAAAQVSDVGFAHDDASDRRRLASLHTLWDGDTSPLGVAMRSAFDSRVAFAPVLATADHAASYPGSDLGQALQQVARIVRGDVGVNLVTVDQGDWDMHAALGTAFQGRMHDNAADLAASVAAFFADLGDLSSRVTLVTISEFGRRVVENASQGLDHGFGSVMLLAGAGVRGGAYHGSMGPLTATFDADVTVTTDYRSVLSEVVSTRFGASTAAVFPGFRPESVGAMTSL